MRSRIDQRKLRGNFSLFSTIALSSSSVRRGEACGLCRGRVRGFFGCRGVVSQECFGEHVCEPVAIVEVGPTAGGDK